jgi:hypothetical protein
MANLELMPHSVLTFLDMILSFTTILRRTMWLLRAPVVFGTFESKHHDFAGASFAEYSKAFPHEELTVGFRGRGPNYFYINTRDNSGHHGPDGQGQGYHDLRGDVDPCFAKVISGHDVVKGMLTGNHSSNERLGVPVSLQAYDLTQIVKAEII